MKNYFLVLCLLPLFLLSSCKDSSLSDLAKDNQWNQVAIEAKRNMHSTPSLSLLIRPLPHS